ncbi:hypothetical protein ACFV4X_36600, partial [Streptomyces ardesiacus]
MRSSGTPTAGDPSPTESATIPDNTDPGPTSTNDTTPAASTTPTASANRTADEICSTQYPGDDITPAPTTPPDTDDT